MKVEWSVAPEPPSENAPDGALWGKQPHESWTAYRAFKTYYLHGPLPRSLFAAYRSSLAETGEKQGRSRISSTWERWAYAKNSRGRRIESAPTWPERAAAYDAFQHQLEQKALHDAMRAEAKKWADRRAAVQETEYRIGHALLARAAQMMQAKVFREYEKNGLWVKEPTEWVERDIAANAKIGSELTRRAVGLPSKADTGEDWRTKLEKAGIDPDVVFQSLVTQIAAMSDQEVQE